MRMAEAISIRIKRYLKEREITQYKLGLLTGIPQNTMKDIVRAKYIGMNTKNLFLIIQALGLTIIEFFDDPMFDLETLLLDE